MLLYYICLGMYCIMLLYPILLKKSVNTFYYYTGWICAIINMINIIIIKN